MTTKLLLKISFALLMTLVVSGCLDINKIPITYIRVIIKHEGRWYCDIRKVTDKSTLSSTRERVASIEECNGTWGVSTEEFSKTREWLKASPKGTTNGSQNIREII